MDHNQDLWAAKDVDLRLAVGIMVLDVEYVD